MKYTLTNKPITSKDVYLNGQFGGEKENKPHGGFPPIFECKKEQQKKREFSTKLDISKITKSSKSRRNIINLRRIYPGVESE